MSVTSVLRRQHEYCGTSSLPNLCRSSSKLLSAISVAACAALLPLSAHAQTTLTLVSNPSTFLESTVIESDNSNVNPWPGVNLAAIGGTLPAVSTYTLATTIGGVATTQPGPGNATLFAQSDVRFFRTTFTLPSFTNLSFNFQATVDNDLDVFVNGHELAQEGFQSGNGFGTPYGVSVAPSGVVTNAGPTGTGSFARIAPTFPQNFFNVGVNDIVIATRNLSGGDTGSFSMLSTATFTPTAAASAPEPGSVALLLTSVLPLFGIVARRHKAA